MKKGMKIFIMIMLIGSIICCFMILKSLNTMKMILNADTVEELELIEETR
jgi:hypothetical protein